MTREEPRKWEISHIRGLEMQHGHAPKIGIPAESNFCQNPSKIFYKFRYDYSKIYMERQMKSEKS
jgi:hypothetical protein